MTRLLAVVIFVGLHATGAAACKCDVPSLAEDTRDADVVAYATVGPVREGADGARSASVKFTDVLRGVVGEQRVTWEKPDGKSCHLTDLRSGTWLLFLSWDLDGQLEVPHCNTNARALKQAEWKKLRPELVTHLGAVKTEADAIESAGRAVRRMLLASMAGKAGTDVASLDLARADRAIVKAQTDGSFVVRWSQTPPAGYAVDAEVRVAKDGVAHVVRATASFSPD